VGIGAIAVVAAATIGLATTPVAAVAVGPETDPAASMYTPGTIVAIDLTLPPASVAALEADPEGDYVEGTFSLAATDGTPKGIGGFSQPLTVGIRLKGGTGSFRELKDEKAAFKIKFNFVKGQKFLGLKKLTLNNMVQDPSMVHETMAYEVFRSLGVPSPRTGYAYVRVNGADYGVYLNLETFDDVFLPRWFGSTRHLYEADKPGVDVSPGGAGEFEVDEGDEGDRTDLEALIAAANSGSGDWSDGMAAVADLPEMAKMWAVERYIGHWDGYAGVADAFRPNNYYLHSEDVGPGAGRFQMLPWGADQTWDARVEFDESAGGLLFNHCLADSDCFGLYEEDLRDTYASTAALDLDTAARCTAERLAPWQAMEDEGRREYDSAEIAEGVAEGRQFIADRPQELAAWLGVPAPAGPAGERPCTVIEESEEIEEPSGPAPPGHPVFSPAADPPPLPVLLVRGRVVVRRGVLVARLRPSGPGELELAGTIATRGGVLRACEAKATVAAAGPVAVRCPLSAGTQDRLAAHWLRIRLHARFTPPTGSPVALDQVVRLRRTGAASRDHPAS
jgi:CotH protein